MLKALKLQGVGPAPEIELQLADRLNVFTGDNGLGKSFLLDVAWWTLSRTWAGNPALPRPDAEDAVIAYIVRGKTGDAEPVASIFDRETQGWPRAKKRPPMPGIVVYARVDGSFSVWDPARNYWKVAPSLNVQDPERPAAYHFDDRSLWHGLSIGERRVCEGLIRDWVGWQKGREPEFDHLVKVLEMLSVPEEPILVDKPTRVSLDEGFDTPTIRTPYGIVPLSHASAGVRRVAGLAYLLVWAWREHQIASQILKRSPEHRIVLLMDEPETHLHPKWQRLIVPALLRAVGALMADEVETQVITATHSPLVLASLEPVFDAERDALFDLDLVTNGAGGTKVECRQVAWRRRGDVSAWLTSEVFDLKSARSATAEQVIEEAARAMADPGFEADQAKKIDASLRAVLGDTDPFWIRWRFIGEQRGWLS